MRKIVYAASAAAVVLGAGTAALATSGGGGLPVPGAAGPNGPAALLAAAPGSTAAPGSAAPGAPGAPGAGHGHGPKGRPALRALDRALHAQWVTRKPGSPETFVTHDAIRGQVTAVSATSITVKALDGVSQTYAVTGSTKVHLRKAGTGNGKARGGAPGTIGDVHTGDQVAVAGTGTTSLTAEHIVDRAD